MNIHDSLEDYVYKKAGFEYMSDLRFTSTWIDVVKNMIKNNEISIYSLKEWEEFFRYVSSKSSSREKEEILSEIKIYYEK